MGSRGLFTVIHQWELARRDGHGKFVAEEELEVGL
jgi:hypothetical protein